MLKLEQVEIRTPERLLFGPLSLGIYPGEILGLQAPSGSGKSVLLRWMLGALPQGLTASGELSLDSEALTDTPTEKRGIGLLLQQPTLFPHLSVAGNLLFAMAPAVDRAQQVSELLMRAGLEGYANRDPATLSGGQQSRVAMLRALAAQPKALLLDEPFSSLDPELRAEFRAWVFDQVRGREIPALIVSHDRDDLQQCSRVLTLDGDQVDV
ncbi:MAG TPA: ATP-binding cassette domain-containing protein [Marinobacterium sp.]|nr:ATP-binding cassette domain-containing protein [Marinobacterium sp.]